MEPGPESSFLALNLVVPPSSSDRGQGSDGSPVVAGSKVGLLPCPRVGRKWELGPCWLCPPGGHTWSGSVSVVPLGVSRLLASGADPCACLCPPQTQRWRSENFERPVDLEGSGDDDAFPDDELDDLYSGSGSGCKYLPFLFPAVCPAGNSVCLQCPTQGFDLREPLQLSEGWCGGGEASQGISWTSSRALRPPSPGLPAPHLLSLCRCVDCLGLPADSGLKWEHRRPLVTVFSPVPTTQRNLAGKILSRDHLVGSAPSDPISCGFGVRALMEKRGAWDSWVEAHPGKGQRSSGSSNPSFATNQLCLLGKESRLPSPSLCPFL